MALHEKPAHRVGAGNGSETVPLYRTRKEKNNLADKPGTYVFP